MGDAFCPDCKRSTETVFDHSAGDMVCSECGLVLEAHSIDETSEWRTFANESADNDPVRVGGPTNPLLTDGGLSTVISKPNGAHGDFLSSSLGRWQNRGSNPDRSLILAFRTIATMADRLGLVATIKRRFCSHLGMTNHAVKAAQEAVQKSEELDISIRPNTVILFASSPMHSSIFARALWEEPHIYCSSCHLHDNSIVRQQETPQRHIPGYWSGRRHHKKFLQRSVSLCFKAHSNLLCQGGRLKEPLQPIVWYRPVILNMGVRLIIEGDADRTKHGLIDFVDHSVLGCDFHEPMSCLVFAIWTCGWKLNGTTSKDVFHFSPHQGVDQQMLVSDVKEFLLSHLRVIIFSIVTQKRGHFYNRYKKLSRR
ncbi:hypothetical protein COCNU_08G008500 [Cocos nucifera]|uniref:TFIIB-type domain-containing protein n=1 Tax=Cocos nucifera TaxID=13894 RepID=A0A8K0II94_COCNU|nr:hypothetical protein COCNU_08G008500 [Cocos nucifera]